MSSSPVIEVSAELVQRYHALRAARAARKAGRCDCNCRKCSSRAPAQASAPMPGTSAVT